jgi:hypothetical protein
MSLRLESSQMVAIADRGGQVCNSSDAVGHFSTSIRSKLLHNFKA